MAYTLIGKNTLIPRITCKARRRKMEKAEDSDSPFLNDDLQVVFEEFELEDCVVQPMTGRTARDFTTKMFPEGGAEYEAFTIYYSGKMLVGPREGSLENADQVLLKDMFGEDAWFTVIKSDAYLSAQAGRFRSWLVKVPEGVEGGV